MTKHSKNQTIFEEGQPVKSRRARIKQLRPRVVAAVVFALIGLGAAIWTLAPSGAQNAKVAGRATRYEERLDYFGVQRDEIAPIPDDEFERITSPAAVASTMTRVQLHFESSSQQVEILAAMPADSRLAFSKSAALALAPFLLGDLDQHLKNVETLGGTQPQSEADWNSVRFRWKYANELMAFTALAPDRAEVVVRRTADTPLDKLDHIRTGYRFGMKDPGGDATRTTARFPEISNWDKEDSGLDVFMARVPVHILMKKSGDTRLGIIFVSMAQNPKTGAWQPAEIGIYHDDVNDPVFRSIEEVDAYIEYMPATLWM